jgi:hypothetical protein
MSLVEGKDDCIARCRPLPLLAPNGEEDLMSRVLCSALVCVAVASSVSADIPKVLSYQGKVTDSGGTPVADGDYSMTFTIYDAETSGTSLWSSGTVTVTVSDGIFSVLLGESPQPTLSLDFDADYWLEIDIAGDVQSPRTPLGSVGYAYMASGIVPGTEMVDSRGSPIFKGTNLGTGAGLRGDSEQGDGVRGESSATDGKGVYGVTTATTGINYGVYGTSSSTSGIGVFGTTAATAGNTSGGYFTSESTTYGRGVFAWAKGTAGQAVGVYGVSSSPSGYAVLGEADATSGTNYGVYGKTNSTDGYGGYFDGRGYFSGKVGIGTMSPDQKLSVIGRVRAAHDSTEAEYTEIYHGGSHGFINWNGDGNFDVRYADDAKVTVEQDGDVGIGTTTPGAKLDVRGSAVFNEDGGNNDFRIEGQTDPNLFFADTAEDRIGIGTDTFGESAKLEVNGRIKANGHIVALEEVTVLDSDGDTIVKLMGYYNGALQAYSPTGNVNVRIGALLPSHGEVTVHDHLGATQAGMHVADSGEGIVWGDTKNFRMENPKDPATEIWYACIEGPEAAAYLRGTARLENGRASISFPDHFKAVATVEGMTIQLTPRSASSEGLALINNSIEGFEVQELRNGSGNYEFDFLVMAIRDGYQDYKVIRSVEEERLAELPE